MKLRVRQPKQGREEEADQYRERVEAIEAILSEYDRQEQERVAGVRKPHADVDWRNPSDAMRKVGAGNVVGQICAFAWVPTRVMRRVEILGLSRNLVKVRER